MFARRIDCLTRSLCIKDKDSILGDGMTKHPIISGLSAFCKHKLFVQKRGIEIQKIGKSSGKSGFLNAASSRLIAVDKVHRERRVLNQQAVKVNKGMPKQNLLAERLIGTHGKHLRRVSYLNRLIGTEDDQSRLRFCL